MKYRADIDGLRAIAVVSVVMFHLEVAGFSGGYVGVDIFFVISGFLITSIIKHKYENHTFKLSDFYFRRVRRLVPPLIATVAATLLGAALIMTPYDMVAVSRSAVAALFSVSNVVFYFESGYWDAASELKPLLHTWSLGVEEQFYLFWPALIVGLLSIRRYISFGASLALISLLGAALCVWFTSVDQSAAFFLLPFRVFQFAIGAWLIQLVSHLQAREKKTGFLIPFLVFWLGLLCIITSVFGFDETTIFPGWAALLPTIGAALILISGSSPSQRGVPTRALMQNPLSIWLGRVSYSMYLVHWPLIVLFRYQYGLEMTIADQLFLAMGTLLATGVLHYGIERYFYQRSSKETDINSSRTSDKRFIINIAGVAALLALIAASAWFGDGWAWREPNLTMSAEQIKKGREDRIKKYALACNIIDYPSGRACKGDAHRQVLILGDSHEVDAYNFLNAGYGESSDTRLLVSGIINDCYKSLKAPDFLVSSDKKCQQRIDALFSPELVKHLNVVIFATVRPASESNQVAISLLNQLKTMNPKIRFVVFGSYLILKRDCSYYIGKYGSPSACTREEHVKYFAARRRLLKIKNFPQVEPYYIDRVELLCRNRALENCLTRTTEGIPMFYDTNHNSLEFAEMSGKMYAKKHPTLLRDLAEH